LSEIQEVMSTLTEVDRLLADIELKISNITQTSNGGSAGTGGNSGLSLRQQVHSLNVMMILVEQMTGDKNIDKAMQKVQQFIMVLMRLRMLLFAIEEVAAGGLGPAGWIYAAANAAGFGISLATLGQ
jgi:hypothetical protein